MKAVVRMATSSRERWVDFARTVICVVMKTARFKSHIELMMMFICIEFLGDDFLIYCHIYLVAVMMMMFITIFAGD